jgi:hypothetical protein
MHSHPEKGKEDEYEGIAGEQQREMGPGQAGDESTHLIQDHRSTG